MVIWLGGTLAFVGLRGAAGGKERSTAIRSTVAKAKSSKNLERIYSPKWKKLYYYIVVSTGLVNSISTNCPTTMRPSWHDCAVKDNSKRLQNHLAQRRTQSNNRLYTFAQKWLRLCLELGKYLKSSESNMTQYVQLFYILLSGSCFRFVAPVINYEILFAFDTRFCSFCSHGANLITIMMRLLLFLRSDWKTQCVLNP